jgi:hypothetical protein
LQGLAASAKDAIFPVRQGIRFVGYRVWPSHVKLTPQNVYRFRRRLRRLADRYFRHEIDWPELARRVMSWWWARLPGRYPFPAVALARRATLPSGVCQIVVVCAARRSTTTMRTCARPTATTTGRTTATTRSVSVRPALRGHRAELARIREITASWSVPTCEVQAGDRRR